MIEENNRFGDCWSSEFSTLKVYRDYIKRELLTNGCGEYVEKDQRFERY